jgi:uncharacterized protein
MKWYNEPKSWKIEGDTIRVDSDGKTDFWRKTHYGFIRDNGHFYYREAAGDFVAEVKVSGRYKSLYDQAGLMVRLNELVWVKCGVEFVNSVQQASAVVTREFSDWSVVPLPDNPPSLWLQIKRRGTALEIFYATDRTQEFTMLRMAYLTENDAVQVGIMSASPDGDGFTAIFENFSIQTP